MAMKAYADISIMHGVVEWVDNDGNQYRAVKDGIVKDERAGNWRIQRKDGADYIPEGSVWITGRATPRTLAAAMNAD
jgi:hypothetical protein